MYRSVVFTGRGYQAWMMRFLTQRRSRRLYGQVNQYLHDTYSLEITFPEMPKAGFNTRVIDEVVVIDDGGARGAVRKYIITICNHAVANQRNYLNQIAVLKSVNVYPRRLPIFPYHLSFAHDADDLNWREYLAVLHCSRRS